MIRAQLHAVITQCCIHEMYLKGKDRQPAVDLAKTFERRKCNHREPIPGDDCITSVIGEFEYNSLTDIFSHEIFQVK